MPQDEIKHVALLRSALGSAAVDQPQIDIGQVGTGASSSKNDCVLQACVLQMPTHCNFTIAVTSETNATLRIGQTYDDDSTTSTLICGKTLAYVL